MDEKGWWEIKKMNHEAFQMVTQNAVLCFTFMNKLCVCVSVCCFLLQKFYGYDFFFSS